MRMRTLHVVAVALATAMAMTTEATAFTRYQSGHSCQSIENNLAAIDYDNEGIHSSDTFERRLVWCPVSQHDVVGNRTVDLYLRDAATSTGTLHEFQCSVKSRNLTTGTLYTTASQTSVNGYQTLTYTVTSYFPLTSIACYMPRADSLPALSAILGYRVTY